MFFKSAYVSPEDQQVLHGNVRVCEEVDLVVDVEPLVTFGVRVVPDEEVEEDPHHLEGDPLKRKERGLF